MTESTTAGPAAAPAARSGPGPWFEDFTVGRVFSGPAWTVPAGVVAALAGAGDATGPAALRAPLGPVAFHAWHRDRGLSARVQDVLAEHWDQRAPVRADAPLHYEMTVVRARPAPEPGRGVVDRHVLVRDPEGTVVQEGRSSVVVAARQDGTGGTGDRSGREFGSSGWARALADRLDRAGAFRRATGTWDGSLGLRIGDDLVQFRVYRGRVLEAGRRTPDGPTFVLAATELTWVRLLTGPVNDFTVRTMRDEFTVEGSAYEYLRLTAALVALVDEARALAGAGQEGGDR